MTNFNDIPTFSNPVTRADFNNIQSKLTNYFISKGLSPSDAVAQAGGVINAQLSGGSVTQNIQQTSDTQAAQAAQRARDQAAADLANAAIRASQNQTVNAKTAIANAALQAEREKLSNFGDNQTVGLCADPDNPRGAKIPCDQADAKLAARQLTTSAYNAPASSVIDQHTIDALKLQGTPFLSNSNVINITKPFSTNTGTSTDPTKGTQTITDPIKNGITILSNDAAAVQDILTKAISGAQKTGADLLKSAQDALSNAGLATTDAGKSALVQIETTLQGGAKSASDAITATEKSIGDAAAATQKAASDAAAAAVKATNDAITSGTKAAQDAAAAAVKAAQDAAAQAAASLAGFPDLSGINSTLSKILGSLQTQSQDPTKTQPPPPPTPNPDLTHPDPPAPKPVTKLTFMDLAKGFLKKYALPITLGISATGAVIYASSRMSKRSEVYTR